MRTRAESLEENEQLAKITGELLHRAQAASDRLEISFTEFQEIFALVLKSNFVDRAAKDLLQAAFQRFEGQVKRNLKTNEHSHLNLKNWLSFYWNIPYSEMEDWVYSEVKASELESQAIAHS
ncbi:MAG: hypothetical protein U0V70_01305 [Terriglobia bacterium]